MEGQGLPGGGGGGGREALWMSRPVGRVSGIASSP